MDHRKYVTAASLRAYRAEHGRAPRSRRLWHSFTPGQKALLVIVGILCFPIFIVVALAEAS